MSLSVYLRPDATCTVNIDGHQLHRRSPTIAHARETAAEALIQHAAAEKRALEVTVFDLDRTLTLKVHHDAPRIEILNTQPYTTDTPPPDSHQAQLVTENGDMHEIGEGLVLGRRPRPVATPDTEIEVLLPVGDATVSKTHLVLHWHAGSLYATDLASTSGTLLHRDNQQRELAPNTPTMLQDRDRLTLGDAPAYTVLVPNEPS